ncbi:conserved hypothetical protein [Xylanimonas cellulosilytica DSM 15894]|uniref:Hly-III family protein n=1 Tax=Xylanimonas cellulosilytica (strain DSM 15894 / JCM 12276 / CECT 5975 / KCTC 9989 / LMG 20990 / NBRC 107835 / XIL07) TaxID=446471 RepID=D1BUT2_XYLCX|nr:hypothetical protein [Xylanimonas cellulosilytica]ACZ29323.1 conserved hypothetical protein [Xylanimonas cellulosilytica DSM 15894]
MSSVPPSCEPLGPALWTQPASAWTSLAFVVAGVAIVVRASRAGAGPRAAVLGVLTVLVGVGSVVQHGPAPSWNPLVHDPPLMGALALVAADGVADLAGRRFRHWWWVAPTAVVVVLAAVSSGASSAAQSAMAVVAVGVTLLRAWRRPAVRARSLAATALLGAGGLIGTLSRPGWPWCDPSSAWFASGWSGHAVWHVLAAAALWMLAPALGSARRAAA